MTSRRRAALGALGTAVLLFAATACNSGSNDSAATTAPAATDATVGSTQASAADPPGTDAPPESTVTSTDENDGDDAPTPSAAPEPTEPPVVVPAALQFTAPLVGGGTFDGAEAAGKPTVFWHWAPT